MLEARRVAVALLWDPEGSQLAGFQQCSGLVAQRCGFRPGAHHTPTVCLFMRAASQVLRRPKSDTAFSLQASEWVNSH